jgi:transposase InsO family protein
MISSPDRQHAVELIREAHQNGARLKAACAELGVDVRTYQRWTQDGKVKTDARPQAQRPEPANKLSAEERAAVLSVCHQPEFASLPPSQIVPRLADQGQYIASESSFYRILREADEQHHRGRSRPPRPAADPPRLVARAPNQVWSWDISWLPGPVKGLFFYLYLILDLYSRKIVGWEIYECESADYAAAVVQRAVLNEQCLDQPLVLHADNGSPMKGETLLETLYRLGIATSYNRPRTSNDNPYSEALFRTCKYRPDYPSGGFAEINQARSWMQQFVDVYHEQHRHSGIRFVTPIQRHQGLDHEILAQRHALYQQARALHPQRWTGATRNWEPITEVWLNPSAVIGGPADQRSKTQ